MNQRTHVGLDVHARSVLGCAIDERTGELTRQRLAANNAGIIDGIKGLGPPVRVVYEAGPTGFVLSRTLESAGITCMVAAPSKLQRPPGHRVKTDVLTELPKSISNNHRRSPRASARFWSQCEYE